MFPLHVFRLLWNPSPSVQAVLQLRVALIIAFERQVEYFCILARKEKLVLAKAKAVFPDADQNQKDSLVRQNELLEVPLSFIVLSTILALHA